ncbi:rhodanese-like domain-containing protein [Nocardioides sp. YIM 152588]|uniref:MBL fold metallo-hydrolase n=1 Tax=Nocardioides sp. YIM 152588 TaxID=3158259 RepID=UPI0032E3719A
MIFTQYYLDCLSQASYLIADEASGNAVVVDPRRDIGEYLADAEERGLTIVGAINTHFHADFVSGHLELAAATGAWIGYGEVAETEFDSRSLAEGERIPLGGADGVTLEIMATPGHTPESISVLVYEHGTDAVPYGVLTGDALFIGDVGRPDLLASFGVTATQLGQMLYDSVQHKLMGLADEVRVFPAHGAGSACGKNLSTETQSTIGEQRRFNYACQPMTEEQFLAVVTAGQPPAPEYFVYNATLNRQQRDLHAPDAELPALDAAAFDAAVAAGAVVIDARENTAFAAGHLAGAINVPVDGRMAETVGMVTDPDAKIVLMAADGEEGEAATRLVRIGFDGAIGYLDDVEGYLLSHESQVRRASRLTPDQLVRAQNEGPVQVVDIRGPGEIEAGMIAGALTIPLAELRNRAGELDPHAPTVLYCAGGWRSSVGASLLRSEGFDDVSDILGGYSAWDAMALA